MGTEPQQYRGPITKATKCREKKTKRIQRVLAAIGIPFCKGDVAAMGRDAASMREEGRRRDGKRERVRWCWWRRSSGSGRAAMGREENRDRERGRELPKMKKLLSTSPSPSLLAICIWYMCLLLCLVGRSQAQNTTNATTDPSEVSALNSIFQKWGVSALSTWNTTGDPCSGSATDDSVSFDLDSFNPAIKCLCNFNNGTTCHITKMKVYAQDARGTIPEELGNLTKLSNLNLAQNYLTGPLPAFIGNLTDMQYLTFGINALSGPIPKEIGNLRKLISLGLGTNNFSGSLPTELGNLVTLEQLYMDSSGVGGEIPSTLANLVNLKTVWASDNAFNGTIPDFIGTWTNLTSLRLQGNSFQGSIPSSFSNLTLLTDLRISDISNGSSSLTFISNMTSLSNLILRNNMISGTIPSNIGDYQSLQQLDLSYNQLSGSFPSWVTQSRLQLNLMANNFVFDDSNSSTLPRLNCLQRNFPCYRDSPICKPSLFFPLLAINIL
ncbi:hypothetical protein MRB53_020810 [Persea americana]|uniref:Uncharacterized protein n=1 Tax=Persea americana TaxID=3435 RepID=A0ACC2L2K9_PERAE|nr:hypothetical protein MRB53_020810 [Persea americana]